MWHKALIPTLTLGLMASSLALAESTAQPGDSNLSMDQVLAQAETDVEAEAARAAASDAQGINPRRQRLQLGGDSAADGGSGFNPAISVILDGVYGNFSSAVDDPPGFGGGHSHGHGHGHGLEEGFQIREAEITFEGAVDPYFDMLVTAAVTDSDIELEEAYVTTRALPRGFQVKAGKFLSDVGYINRQHVHDWDFADQPWMREFLFGEEGLNEKGVQASWVAPTAHFTRFGVEVLEGETPGVANFVGADRKEAVTLLPDEDDDSPNRVRWRDSNGLENKTGPRLFTAFANYAPNLGHDHAIQFGISGGYTNTFQDEDFHSSARLETWDGDGWFAGTDVVYKYNGRGIHGHGNLTLQAEYFVREQDLTYHEQQFDGDGNFQTTGLGDIRPRQDGMYVQGVYGFAPRWNGGLRLDAVGMTNKAFDGTSPEDASTSYRYTGQVSFMPTEFSRIRAQLQLNDLHEPAGAHDHDTWQFFLQYNISLGAHGAHAF